MGTVLVDHHQARLHGRHDILSLELVVGGSFLLHYRFCGCGFLLRGKQIRRGFRWALCLCAFQSLIELIPSLGSCGLAVVLRWSLFERIVARVVLHLGRADIPWRVVENGNLRFGLRVEVDGGNVVEFAHRILDGCHEDLPDGLLVLKLDLALGGMDVDVDVLRAHGEIEEIGHLLIGGNQSVECRDHRLVEVGMAHVATIDEEILRVALLL